MEPRRRYKRWAMGQRERGGCGRLRERGGCGLLWAVARGRFRSPRSHQDKGKGAGQRRGGGGGISKRLRQSATARTGGLQTPPPRSFHDGTLVLQELHFGPRPSSKRASLAADCRPITRRGATVRSSSRTLAAPCQVQVLRFMKSDGVPQPAATHKQYYVTRLTCVIPASD